MDNIKIGEFIAKLRKEKNMTQMELADKLYISDRAVSKWERGICMPDISIIGDLAKYLDISVTELLQGEKIENMTKEKSDKIIKETIIDYTNVEKDKSIKRLLLVTFPISIVFLALMFLAYIPIVLIFDFVTYIVGLELDVIAFYQNPYTFIAVILGYIVIGIVLFILFRLI